LLPNALTPPSNPLPRRFRNFGAVSSGRSAYTDPPSPFLIIHHIWTYVSDCDRLALTHTHPAILAYARLRYQATSADLSGLLLPRAPPDSSPVDPIRVHYLGCALLRFNFVYGDLVRWLEGPYTDAHRNWSDVFATLEMARDRAPPQGFPEPDYDRAIRLCTEGAPLSGKFVANYHSCSLRNCAALSADLIANQDDVDATLCKEEKLSYHLILPRFLWRFIPGLFLAIFRVAYRHGDPKPRLCVDPSTVLGSDDTGNANRHIPKPGVIEDMSPAIHYGSAFLRGLIWLWNLRISYPREDILMLTDDISGAFRRVLYHPDMAVCFAAVWRGFLILPVGTIFGAGNSPGFFGIKGELRSHYAHHLPPVASDAAPLPLVARVTLPPIQTAVEAACLSQATPDTLNPGILSDINGLPERRHPIFVDDTLVAHIRQYFLDAVHASVHSAYTLFGHPDDDPTRPPCINPLKWTDNASWHVRFLGFSINTRLMRVSWPPDKREKLLVFLRELLQEQVAARRSTPRTVSRILGLVRHAAMVSPLGVYRSLRLQHFFNDCVSSVSSRPRGIRRWYARRSINLPPCMLSELQQLFASISPDLHHPAWSSPIGLIVPRTPTIHVFTDASLGAMGGWSPLHHLNHMWRLTWDDLVQHGFPSAMGWCNAHNYLEPAIDEHKKHINILEFVAIFIELWISVRQLHFAQLHGCTLPGEHIPPGGHRIWAQADNTSALSWLRYASRTRRPPIRRLARLLTAFLSHSSASNILRVQGEHLAGKRNTEADSLSRFELYPSWESVMASSPALTNLRTCLLPPKLLSLIASAFSREQTADWYETATTELWTIAPPVFATGSARLVGTATSLNSAR
jgi:hypothetical protein